MRGRQVNWPENWEQQMRQVDAEINLLPYRDDAEQWGVDDFWDNIEDSGSGDCDSYAVGKLRRLFALGWPIEALHLAICYVETGGSHGVLVVQTPQSSYVMDNRMEPFEVYKLQARKYQPHEIQAVGGQRGWREWLVTPAPA